MYTQTWNKYLPLIKILLKKAVNEEQFFKLNVPDFDKAGPAQKKNYKFSVQFVNGRAIHNANISIMAKDFIIALLQDDTIKELFQSNEYHISMDSKFQLNIKHIPKPMAEEALPAEMVEEVAQTEAL